MKKFHVIQNIPSPYRLHLFNEMWRQLSDAGVEFHVHFMSDFSRGHDDRPLSWHNPKIDFPHTYWRDYGIGCHHLNPSMLCHLRHVKPDYLLIGSTFDTFTGFAASQLCSCSTRCAWTEGNTKTPGRMGGVLGWIKRQAFSRCEFVAVPGHDAVRYIELHQALTSKKMPRPIFLPNMVDETKFKPRCMWSLDEISQMRRRFGADDSELVALSPARLEPVKGLEDYFSLLDADKLNGWRIVVLGQGVLKEKLLAIASDLGWSSHLTILDFIPYDEMPLAYAASDLFLLPSKKDRNPLSVVEALHSGLPVAVSEMAGNVEEAVTPGKNGWVLPVTDALRFKRTLGEIFSTRRDVLIEKGEMSISVNARFWKTGESVSRFLAEVGAIAK